MRGARACLVVVALAGCHDFQADLATCADVGKCAIACTSDAQCASGQRCNQTSGQCEVPQVDSCPWPAFPPVPACGNDRDLYLAADGVDSNPGTIDRPRRTLTGLTLLPGDRVQLAAGLYTAPIELDGDGTASCPISMSGAADGGSVIRSSGTESLRLGGSFWQVSALRVEGGGQASSAPVVVSRPNGGRVEAVRLRQLEVHLRGDAQAHVLIERCTGCVVERGTFTSEASVSTTSAIQVWSSSELVVLGNRFSAPIVLSAIETRSGSTNATVVGNGFRGCRAANFDATGAVFARNVVSDVSGGTMVAGAGLVTHNTFLRFGTGVAASGGRFSGNLVSIGGVARSVNEGGGYNLFNAVLPSPDGGVDATDLIALPKIDAEGALLEASPAIDAADPADPVPPGGGSRADIGAFERGAVRLSDGRYCLAPDAGW